MKSAEITIKLSECRQKLNGLADDSPDFEALKNEYDGLEVELRSALEQENRAAESRPEDGAGAEIRSLRRRASLGVYLLGMAAGRHLEGAEAELRAAEFGDEERDDLLPLSLLLPAEPREPETRADAASGPFTAIQENQASIAGRVFAQSAGAYMGVSTPTVAVGTASYPALSTGTTADVRSDGVGKDAEAATVGVVQINPVRLSAGYLFAVEDLSRLRGLEEALAADLRAVLSDKRDALIINGQAAVANVSPAMVGLLDGTTLTPPDDPAAVSALFDYLGAFDNRIDGKISTDGSNVRVLVGSDTHKHALGRSSGDILLRNILPAGRFRSSAQIAAAASTIAQGLTYAQSDARGFVAPVWAGVSVIRDPYSKASEGQVRLTLTMQQGQAMVDSSPYSAVKFKIAA